MTSSATATPPRLVLIADDDDVLTELIQEILHEAHFRTATVGSGALLEHALRKNAPDVLLLDYYFPPSNGLELLREVRRSYPDLPVIILTAGTSERISVELMKHGADDYLLKHAVMQDLVGTVENVLKASRRARRDELFDLMVRMDNQPVTALRTLPLSWLFGSSEAMHQIIGQIEAVAELPTRVLILGETGTGKELLAKVLHYRSERFDQNFIPVNCAAIPEALLESELFGYERGAFTGAVEPHDGLFKAADGGTVLLDEVSEMPMLMQAKLLRVLQEGEIRRVGGRLTTRVDVRVVAASNRNLKECVDKGEFRRDLYFRLNVVTIHLPPLRDRLDDLPHLADYFVRKFAVKFSKEIREIEPDVFGRLTRYSWPGNIRELEHAIEKAVIFAKPPALRLDDIGFLDERLRSAPIRTRLTDKPFFEAREEFERDYISRLLQRTKGNLSEASRIAELGRTTLREKAQKLGLL
ncbi:MAG: sigma-54-dependent Fis family transcriptional regulator [Candidatus Schekmanbacteria bacterium]|nr:sigma-54-dependent Fis family transcriptional regulator [Candidatus Schekmanbacteria bacterium]